MTKNILLFCFFLLFGSVAAVAQSTERNVSLLMDSRSHDIIETTDNAILVAYVAYSLESFGEARIVVQKYNLQGELLWEKTVLDNPLHDVVHDIALLARSDGQFVLFASPGICDVGLPAILALCSPEGTVEWQTTNDASFDVRLAPAEDNNFYAITPAASGGVDFTKYSPQGLVLEIGTSIYPVMGLQTTDGVVSFRDNAFVKNQNGSLFFYPWDNSPVYALVDYDNGDIAVFGYQKIYRLNSSLQLISTLDFGEEYTAVDLCPDGFITTVAIDSFLFLQRYNDNGELIQILNLGKYAENPNFLVKNNRFYLAATNNPPQQSSSNWVISADVSQSGQWQSQHDLAITGIQFSGVPTATAHPGFPQWDYSVDYTDVFAVVENKGSQPVHRFHLKNRMEVCGFICANESTFNVEVETTILPGETKTVYMANIVGGCITSSVSNLCIWASEVGDVRDDQPADNVFCTSIPDIVAVRESVTVPLRMYPNPAQDVVVLDDAQYLNQPYRLYNSEGKLLSSGRFTGKHLDIGALSAGTYHLEVVLENNVSGVGSFVKK
jgi:hypothetical protein